MWIKVFLLIVFAESLALAGQIFFKKGINGLRVEGLSNLGEYFHFLRQVLKSPKIWWGLGVTVGWAILWLAVLDCAELSLAFPIESIQYILIIIASYFFLKEPISWTRVLGTLLIVLGIILVPLG